MLLSRDKMVVSQFIKAMSFNISVFCLDKKTILLKNVVLKILGTDTSYI